MPNATAPTATENPLKVAMGWAMVVLLQWSWVTPWQPKRQGLSLTLTSGAHGWGPNIFLIDSAYWCIFYPDWKSPPFSCICKCLTNQIYKFNIYIERERDMRYVCCNETNQYWPGLPSLGFLTCSPCHLRFDWPEAEEQICSYGIINRRIQSKLYSLLAAANTKSRGWVKSML